MLRLTRKTGSWESQEISGTRSRIGLLHQSDLQGKEKMSFLRWPIDLPIILNVKTHVCANKSSISHLFELIHIFITSYLLDSLLPQNKTAENVFGYLTKTAKCLWLSDLPRARNNWNSHLLHLPGRRKRKQAILWINFPKLEIKCFRLKLQGAGVRREKILFFFN